MTYSKRLVELVISLVITACILMTLGGCGRKESITTAMEVRQPSGNETSPQARMVCFDTQGHTKATRWAPLDKFDGRKQPLYLCGDEPATMVIASGPGGCGGGFGGGFGGRGGRGGGGLFISYDPVGHPTDPKPVWRRIYGCVEPRGGLSGLDEVSLSMEGPEAMYIGFGGSVGVSIHFASVSPAENTTTNPNLPQTWVSLTKTSPYMLPPWFDTDEQSVPRMVSFSLDPVKKGLVPYLIDDFQKEFFKVGWSFEGCFEKGGFKGCVRGGK